MYVIIYKGGEVISRAPYRAYADARREFNRIARNAWRRKRAYNQVQFMEQDRMSWYEGGVHFYACIEN